MSAVFINFPKTEMTFYLFDDEVDGKMAKKLGKLGLADFQVSFPENHNDKFLKGNDNLWYAGEFPQDGFPVTLATDDSKFSTTFDKESNSISVCVEGRFLCFNRLEDDHPHSSRTIGYVSGIRLNNAKGKLIKKPKDEWGVSSPLEALAEKGNYDGGSYQVEFSIDIEQETYLG